MSTALQLHIAKKSPMYFTRNCYDRPYTPTDSVKVPQFIKAENMTPAERKLLRQNLKKLSK